jgi:hypothetical protein
MRAELTDAYAQNSELARQYLEQSRVLSDNVARLLKMFEESLVSRQPAQNLGEVESSRIHRAANGIQTHNGAAAAASDTGALAIPLDNLRNTIQDVNPILRRLVEHLRRQAEETTHAVSVKFQPTVQG